MDAARLRARATLIRVTVGLQTLAELAADGDEQAREQLEAMATLLERRP